jgi:GNAT superfamily N-acetyltransferase
VKTKWLDRADTDQRDIAGVVAVLEACRATDHPHFPVRTVSGLTEMFRHGFDEEPPEYLVAYDDRGHVVGACDVWLPRRDNTYMVFTSVLVDPANRRRGVGRVLVEEIADYARRDGRTVIMADSADRPEYAAFATAMGFDQTSYTEVYRRQDLVTIDWPRLDREYAAAERYATDYELIRIAGEMPAELLDRVVTLTAAINDAPHTSETAMEAEVFTPERLRAFESAQTARDFRIYRVLAQHKVSGELGGHTVVGIDAEQPWHASQYDTSVLKSHRGHRLGLLLKIEMLRWLADEEPQLRELTTANAQSNEHMIKVNEMLGYEVFDRLLGWERKL